VRGGEGSCLGELRYGVVRAKDFSHRTAPDLVDEPVLADLWKCAHVVTLPV